MSPHIPRALRKRMTSQEVKVWNWLREEVVPAGYHFRRQVPIDCFIVDFACLAARLVVEIDGEQHGHEQGRTADMSRDARLVERGFRVLRFSNREVDRERRIVMDTIFAAVARVHECLDDPHPSPPATPSPAGEGSGAAGVPLGLASGTPGE